ncbi:hypothetical protein M0R45_000037 [Rubus argutus]|uniref:Legume lectin domain-containing protein n=1 Tax=Rubus argutus TaxID=59490 RepID=A0AAW1VNL9_RUBAR
MTDFTSNFTFFIESANDSRYGDGLAFFIAPNGSSLNSTLGRGSSLGLPVDSQRNVSRSLYSFVAVEFDIFHNGGTAVDDPPSDHVGIDINSVKSIITLPWNGSVLEEKGNRARITYNSSTKVLRASYSTYDNSGIPDTKTIQHTVDLQQYLPEMVIVGFSASTGTQSALHKIKTWSFSSTLVHHRSSHKTGNGMINVRLVVGLSIGGCIIILVSGLGLIRFRFWKKEQAGESDGVEDPMEINDSIDEEFERATGPRKFSYSELAHATGSQIIMVDWVWELYGEGKVLEAADPKLCGDFDGKEMECLLIVGLWCAYPDYTCRPSIQQAIQVLNGEAPLPILPSDMPVPKFPPAMSDSGSCSGGDKTDFHGTASSLKNSHSSRSLP